MTRADLIEVIKVCYAALLESKVLVVKSSDEQSSEILKKMTHGLEMCERALGDEHAEPK